MIRLYNNLHVYIKMLAVISNQNETASNPTASNLKSGTWENIKSKEGNFSKRIRKMPRDPYPFPRYENDNEFSSHSNLEVSLLYYSVSYNGILLDWMELSKKINYTLSINMFILFYSLALADI